MNVTLTLLTCMAFMAVVAIISYMKTKGEVNTQDGYFFSRSGVNRHLHCGLDDPDQPVCRAAYWA